jgi:hypothetical protein
MAITKEEREKMRIEWEQKKAAEKLIVDTLLAEEEMLDEDGYPTLAAETIVKLWPWEDKKGWFLFIESIWHLRSWGWHEGDYSHDIYKDKMVRRYDISTAGWSGNEGLIAVMQENDMMWHTTWVQSRRGGHYIFEVEQDD